MFRREGPIETVGNAADHISALGVFISKDILGMKGKKGRDRHVFLFRKANQPLTSQEISDIDSALAQAGDMINEIRGRLLPQENSKSLY